MLKNTKSKISNHQSLRVLMVEDSEDDALLIIRELKKGGYDPEHERVETATAMKKALKDKQWDIILCDYKLPKFSGPQAIALLKETNIDIPLIVVSGSIGEDVAIECMRLGAYDYIMKNNLSRLCPAIARELEEAETRGKRKQAEQALLESEEKYRNLVERARDGIGIAQDGILRYANERLAQISGYSVVEAIGKPFIYFFAPDEVPKVLDRYKRRMAGKKVTSVYETVLKHKEGSRIDVEVNAGVVTYEGKHADLVLVRDITERKQAEDALRKSEENFRRSLDDSPLGVRIATAEGETIYANQAVLEIYGYDSIEELKRTPLKERYTPESYTEFRIRKEKRERGEFGPSEYKINIVRKNGEFRYVQVFRKEVIWNGERQLQIIYQDITERKRAEKKLTDSEEKFRMLAESSSFAIMMHQGDNWIYANRAAQEISGYTEEELCSMHFWDIVHPDYREMVKQTGYSRQQGKVLPRAYEFKIIAKDGVEKWVSLTGNSIQYEDKPTALISVTDITERKQSERKLINSEEKYRHLVENSQEGIFQSTADGHYVTVNQAFANILGYDSPEDIMSTVADIGHQIYVHTDDRTKILQIIEKEGSVKGYEAQFYKKDGSKTWVSINMHAVRDEKGHLLYYQGIDQDIKEKKDMEIERQENIERLRKSLGATINAMAVTVETRDPYTAGHQRRVADLACAIAGEMNMKSEQIEGIRMASMIHDIGKISIPSEILSKPTKLTDLEFSLIKTHSQSGYDILKDIEFPWPVADVVLQHHERMDGSGYPQRLKGENILLDARILAIADVVEAITFHRPYRPALGIDFALEEISRNRIILYDADAVDACLILFKEKGYDMVL
jgi:PAS domain S-box-containing protein